MRQAKAAGYRARSTLDLRVLRFWNRPGCEEPVMLAHDLVEAGRTEDALAVTRAAMTHDPDDPELLVARGLAWLERSEPEVAQRLFTRAARHASEWDEPWELLAEVLVQRGQPERAARVLEKTRGGREKASESAPTEHSNRSVSMGDVDARLTRFHSDPDKEEPALLAHALLDAGRVDEALEVTEATLAMDPGDADVWLVHARGRTMSGDTASARRAAECAAMLEPGWEEAERFCVLLRRMAPPEESWASDDQVVEELVATWQATPDAKAEAARPSYLPPPPDRLYPGVSQMPPERTPTLTGLFAPCGG